MARKKEATPENNPNCQLGRWPGDGNLTCRTPEQCKTCGWNPDVARARKEKIRKGGFLNGPSSR